MQIRDFFHFISLQTIFTVYSFWYTNESYYINSVLFIANYLTFKGYEGQKEFCATQWPLESTAGDFWKVISQEKSAAIVCMENNIDDDKVIENLQYV